MWNDLECGIDAKDVCNCVVTVTLKSVVQYIGAESKRCPSRLVSSTSTDKGVICVSPSDVSCVTPQQQAQLL